MTHFKVELQLPLRFNPIGKTKQGKLIPQNYFYNIYCDLRKIAGGVHTTNLPIMGSWICPKTKKVYNDKSTGFTLIVESGDIATVANVKKLKELKKYKNKLITKFQQESIYMVATRCCWL